MSGNFDERLLVHLSNFRPVKRVLGCDRSVRSSAEENPVEAAVDRRWARSLQAEWLAVQKGIHEHVLFLGKQDQIREKLAISDVLFDAKRIGNVRAGGAGRNGLRGRPDCHPHRRRARR